MADKVVVGHMKKAFANLESAHMLFKNGMYDNVVTSSYYAVFHGISALLANKGMEFGKHKTVIGKFNEVFIHAGLISSTSFRSLNSLFRRRMNSEYNPIIFEGEDGANEALYLAQDALQEILDYCNANNIQTTDAETK